MTGQPDIPAGQVSRAPTGQPRVSGVTADRLGVAFYTAVAAIALAGQALAAVRWLGWPLFPALSAVAVLELGGIALAARADFRRRLGEHALTARLLSGAVAVFAVAFNWLGHADHLAGGFFAGMSALGYSVWLINAADRRRDQLRAKGDLPAVPPAYGAVQWLAHPWLTRRARALAKADPDLGLYASLTAAEQAVRTERRTRAIAATLHRKLAAAVDPVTAEIAVHTYDLEEIAKRLAAGADYDGLTALIAADLAPGRLTDPAADSGQGSRAAGQLRANTASPVPPASPVTAPVNRSPVRLVSSGRGRSPVRGAAGEVSIDVLADTLDRWPLFTDRMPGRPAALTVLREQHGSCSTERAREAVKLLAARRSAGGTDGQERSA